MPPKHKSPFIQTEGSNPPLPAPPCVTNEDLAEEIQHIKVGVYEIKMALTGNKLGTKGVIPRLDELEVKQESSDRKLIKWSGMAAGAGLLLATLKDWVLPHKP